MGGKGASGKRLGREEWIDAGLRAIARQGADAVRVERLAEALGVTKGSFYWHFKDRNALLAALLEAWKVRATKDIIAEVEAKGGDAATRLRTLFGIALHSDGRLDLAMRAWAAQDSLARGALEQVDRRRLAYLDSLFRALAFSPAEASARTRFVYHALIGQFTMGVPAAQRKRLADWLDILYPMLLRKA